MAGQLDPTINVILQGENRVLEEFQKIQQRAQETGQKISQVMGASFQTSSAVVEKIYSRMAGVAKDVHTRLADGFGKVSGVFKENIARITGVVQGVSAKMAQPMVEAYREGFRAVSRLAKESKTGQFLTQQIQRAGGALQEHLVSPWKAGLARMQGMASARFQAIADRAKQALAQTGGGLGGRLKEATGGSLRGAATKGIGGMLGGLLGGGGGDPGGGGKGGGGVPAPDGGGMGKFATMAMAAGGVTLAIGGLVKGFQAAYAMGQKFYDGMIGANEKLNQEILGSAANLAATSRVMKNGVEMLDPTEKIQALQGPLRDALKQIAEDSISLVGVTSADLTGVFATLNSQASQLAGQSKEFSSAIDSAGKLTIDFSAALGTIGLPLAQAGQEMRSILTANIDNNSTLAKQLGITNDMVKRWKAQGVLVDKLREKLKPFVEGNALAAKSIGGVTSNITDVLQIIQREIGEPLLEPVVEGLQWIYDSLDKNREKIQSLLRPFINQAIEVGRILADELQPVLENWGRNMEDMQPLLLDLFRLFTMALVGFVKIATPILEFVQRWVSRLGKAYNLIRRIVNLLPGFSDGRQAIDEMSGSTDTLVTEQQKLEGMYKTIAEKKRDGIALTEEEIALEAQLRGLAEQAVEAIDTKIDALKALRPADAEQREMVEAEIERLERLKRAYQVGSAVADYEAQITAAQEALETATGNEKQQLEARIAELERLKAASVNTGLSTDIESMGASIEELGNSFQQLGKQAQEAREKINRLTNEGGDTADLQATAKQFIDLTQQQVDMGMITREQAAENLKEIAGNVKVELSIREQAAKALVKLAEDTNVNQLQLLQDATRDAERAIEAGTVGQVEGARQVTEAKQAELNQQLQDVKDAIKEEDRVRREQIEKQIADLDGQITTAKEAVDGATTGSEKQAEQAVLDGLRAQRNAAQASLNIQSDRGRQLTEQERTIQDQLATEVIAGNRRIQDAYKNEAAAANQGIQDQIRDIEAQIEAGTLSQVDGAQKLTKLRGAELQNQVDAVKNAIADEEKLREGDNPTVREKELLAELATLEDQQRANTRQGYRDDAQARQAALDLQVQQVQQAQSELELAVRTGEKNRVDAAREGTALQQEQIQLQISGIANQIDAERKVRGNRGAPTQREKELLLQQAALYNQLESVTLDGEVSLRDAQLQEIQETNSRVLDAIGLSATERELALQRRVNAAGPGGVTPEERAAEELEIRKASLQAELEAEQENIAKIKALPMPKDPAAREQVEAQIRGSLQKTTDLTLQLARLEEQAMKAAIAEEQEAQARQLRARLNQLTAERQALEAQMQLYEQILAQMQRQIDLVNEQVAAAQQLENLTQSYYAKAAEFTKSEFKARKIQEEAAKLKIKQLEKQQEIERIQLELKLEQNKAMKEQAILQAQIAQVQAKAAEAQAMADYAKAAADPTTRPEELDALRLGIQAAQVQGQAANFGMAMAVEDYQRLGASAAQQRGALADQQDAAMFDAQADYAKITRTQSDDRAMGTRALGLARGSARRTDEAYETTLDAVNATSTAFDDFSARLAEFSPTLGAFQQSAPPQIQTPAPGLSIAGVPGSAGAGMTGMGGGSNSYSFEFNNTFTGSGQPDGAAVQTFENQVLNTMKRVLDLV